jgi:adenosylcobinamide-GDP ribazoletransferase
MGFRSEAELGPISNDAVRQDAVDVVLVCSNGLLKFSAPMTDSVPNNLPTTSVDTRSGGRIRRGVGRYFAAQQLLTRLPCPKSTPWQPADLAASTAWFPSVGFVIAVLTSAVVALFGGVFGFVGMLLAVVAIAVPPILTGGFHEDAFADVCDAFGAMNPQRRREIMRDSLVGSFGAAGLSILLLAKFAALANQQWKVLIAVILCAHMVARWSSVVMIKIAPYVEDADSLAKPYAGTVTPFRLVAATIVPTVPFTMLIFGLWRGAAILAGVVLLCALGERFFRRWVGGITGDCLGAINQLVEVLVYVVAAQPAVTTFLNNRIGSL